LLFLYSVFNFYIIQENKTAIILKKINFKNELTYLLIYFLLITISISYSSDKLIALDYLIRLSPFLITPILFILINNPKENDKFLIRKLFVYSLSLVLILLFINAIYKNHQQGYSLIDYLISIVKSLTKSDLPKEEVIINFWFFTYEGLTQILDIQPIYLSLFINLGLIFLIVLFENNKIKPLFFWVLVFNFLLFSLLLSSRTETIIFFLIIFSYILFVKPKTKKGYFKGILISALFISFIFSVIFYNPILKFRFASMIIPDYTHEHLKFSNQSFRLKIWTNSKEAISESPFFGYGIGDYKTVLYNKYVENGFKEGLDKKLNSHNQYLDILLQLGLLGFIILIIFFYKGIFMSKRTDIEKRYIYITFALSFLTESMFDRHWGIMSFVLFTAFVSKYNITNFKNENCNFRD
jgi:O-antigen ligase